MFGQPGQAVQWQRRLISSGRLAMVSAGIALQPNLGQQHHARCRPGDKRHAGSRPAHARSNQKAATGLQRTQASGQPRQRQPTSSRRHLRLAVAQRALLRAIGKPQRPPPTWWGQLEFSARPAICPMALPLPTGYNCPIPANAHHVVKKTWSAPSVAGLETQAFVVRAAHPSRDDLTARGLRGMPFYRVRPVQWPCPSSRLFLFGNCQQHAPLRNTSCLRSHFG